MNTVDTTPHTYAGTYCTDCGEGPMLTCLEAKQKNGIRVGAHGRCNKCDSRMRYRIKKGLAPDQLRKTDFSPPADDEAQHRANVASLDAFLAARRRRGVPARGDWDDDDVAACTISAPTITAVVSTEGWMIRKLPGFTDRPWFGFKVGHHVLWGDTRSEVRRRIERHDW